mmetsp:Transcript_120587/g.209374  ORF Transcript_120587/g.209374 Transcript_120587/m.209374 type:complete len:215 (-) Transcript_120587:898-1542(-)
MISDSRLLTALCSKLLQGCRKKTSKHRGSSCSASNTSQISEDPVLTSVVRRLSTSSMVMPTEGTVPTGKPTFFVCSRLVHKYARIRGRCPPTSRISAVLRASARFAVGAPLCELAGDMGGEDRSGEFCLGGTTSLVSVSSSSAPKLTTSSSLSVSSGGETGERAPVFVPGVAATVAMYELWRTLLRIAMDADVQAALPLKMRSTSRRTAAGSVS